MNKQSGVRFFLAARESQTLEWVNGEVVWGGLSEWDDTCEHWRDCAKLFSSVDGSDGVLIKFVVWMPLLSYRDVDCNELMRMYVPTMHTGQHSQIGGMFSWFGGGLGTGILLLLPLLHS